MTTNQDPAQGTNQNLAQARPNDLNAGAYIQRLERVENTLIKKEKHGNPAVTEAQLNRLETLKAQAANGQITPDMVTQLEAFSDEARPDPRAPKASGALTVKGKNYEVPQLSGLLHAVLDGGKTVIDYGSSALNKGYDQLVAMSGGQVVGNPQLSGVARPQELGGGRAA